MTQGFYKKDDDNNLIYAPNFIEAPNYKLIKELKDTYTYPIDGWYWYDSLEEAENQFNLSWQSETCYMRIVAPITLIDLYPQILFDLTVIRKLQVEKINNNIYIYCNYIEPEHQQMIDNSNGMIYIENKPE